MGVQIQFDGLCLFDLEALPQRAIMPHYQMAGHPPHRVFLLVRSPNVNMDIYKKPVKHAWRPDGIVHYDKEQYSFWKLEKHELDLRPISQALTGGPVNVTSTTHEIIDLREFHKNATIRRTALGKAAIINLRGGSIAGSCSVPEVFDLMQKNVKVEEGEFAETVTWSRSDWTTMVRVTDKRTKQYFEVQPDTSNAVRISVTNAAAEPNGLQHFMGYYTLLTGATETHLTLKSGAFKFPSGFNCVPPTRLTPSVGAAGRTRRS